MSNKSYSGSIGISKINGSEEHYIEIQIEDKDSCSRFVTVEISLKEFAEAITGLHGAKCTLQFRDLDKVGKLREQKEEFIKTPKEFPGNWDSSKEEKTKWAKEIVKPFEVNGWEAMLNQIDNHYYYQSGKEEHKFVFIRYVERKED